MEDFDDLYGGQYLAATDLKQGVFAVIEKIESGVFARDGKTSRPKMVLHFRDAKKPVILNKTNAVTLASAYGKDFNAWIGKKVRVEPEKTPFGGKIVPCIRLYPVREQQQQVAAPAPKPAPESPHYTERNPPPPPDYNDEIPW
jgi:hypothetical protein